jgi:hypothetical protein
MKNSNALAKALQQRVINQNIQNADPSGRKNKNNPSRDALPALAQALKARSANKLDYDPAIAMFEQSASNPLGGRSAATGRILGGVLSGLNSVQQREIAQEETEKQELAKRELIEAISAGNFAQVAAANPELAKTLYEDKRVRDLQTQAEEASRQEALSRREFDKYKLLGDRAHEKAKLDEEIRYHDLQAAKDAAAAKAAAESELIAGIPKALFMEIFRRLDPESQALVAKNPELIWNVINGSAIKFPGGFQIGSKEASVNPVSVTKGRSIELIEE